MKKRKTLEDYLKDDLIKRAKALGATGYSAWITQHGSAPMSSYAKKTSEIYRKEAVDKKSRAGALGTLASSGYADYIGDAARRDVATKKQNAVASYDAEVAAGIKGYEQHLDDYSEKYKKLYESVEKTLRNEKIASAERALERALELGLSDTDAKRAAEKISAEVTEKVRGEVMTTIVEKRLTQNQARLYAIGLGLSEDIAEELAKYAYELNEEVKSSGYLDYLRELEKQQKEKKGN